MKYCSKCGNQLLDQAILCPNCGCMVEGASPMYSTVPSQAPIMNSTVTTPEVSVATGSPVKPIFRDASYDTSAVQQIPTEYTDYSGAVENAAATNTASIGLLVLSAVVWYFFSVVIGTIMALVAALIAYRPSIVLKGMLKYEDKDYAKSIRIHLRMNNRAFSLSCVLAPIAWVVFCLFLFSIEYIYEVFF